MAKRKSRPGRWATFTIDQKTKYIKKAYDRRNKRKAALVALKGGKCQKCGYNTCIRCLSFHHRNPSEKKMRLDTRQLAATNWNKLVAEVEKCDLLCLNCHMEEEDRIIKENARELYSGRVV